MPDQDTPTSLLNGLKQAAKAAGWDVEWSWKDSDDDETHAFNLYLWPTTTTED